MKNYLIKDVKHFLVNIGISSSLIVVYAKFGFLGWAHLLSVFFIHYCVIPLDDWLEKERPFPFYILPLIFFSGYFYSQITILALIGVVIVNTRALIKKDNFLLERLEGLGNIPIYVLPLLIPAGLNNLQMYLATILFISFVDSFHKIGHQETKHEKLMWISGILFLLLASFIFGSFSLVFVFLFTLILISLIPFKVVRDKKIIRIYSQIWFGLMTMFSFYYYLFFVVN